MKAKLLNPLQEMMGDVVSNACDMLVQNCGSACYTVLKDWLCSSVILYALTVDSGNDTYVKTIKNVWDKHIRPQCECDSHCNAISSLLDDMITLLTA